MQAGRYIKSVRYRRVLPHDSAEARAAKSASTSKAQRYINLKNAAEKLEMLLCANFDIKNACFCTFTFTEDNLPVNRKMTVNCFKGFISDMRKTWKKNKRQLLYIYNVEGSALSQNLGAAFVESDSWEIRPWLQKKKWESLGKRQSKSKKAVRFHVHAFFILDKAERAAVRKLWPYGHVYINTMRVEHPDTFRLLSYYITKESRDGSRPAGSRSYIPSRNLQQPTIEGHWCDAHEVFLPPQDAENVVSGNEETNYTSYHYISYRLPRLKKHPKPYKSKGRL
jgi:hypothetical protein